MRLTTPRILIFGGLLFMVIGLSLWLIQPVPAMAQTNDQATYVGSSACTSCHKLEGASHKLSAHPLALQKSDFVADFAAGETERTLQLPGQDAARAITADDIAFAIGAGNAIQRYVYKAEDGQYFVLPIEWNVQTKAWQAYKLAENWPDPAYDFVKNCASCHTTGLNTETNKWKDAGVECESCHGPGSNHFDLADEASKVPSEEELKAIREAIIAKPSVEQTCKQCHQDTETTVGLHFPSVDMFEGKTLIENVAGEPSVHFTAEKGPNCQTCHMLPTKATDKDGQVVDIVSHDMKPILPNTEGLAEGTQDSCTSCHSDVDPASMRKLVDDQQKDVQTRLEKAKAAVKSDSPSWVATAISFVEGDGSFGVHNSRYTTALLDAVEVQLGLATKVAAGASTHPVMDPAGCAECHQDTHRQWLDSPHAKASLSNSFRQEFAANKQPTYCMGCHASGYDSKTGDYVFEGVVCSSCHYTEGNAEHPPASIKVDTSSAACGTCHSGAHAPAYDEWLISPHSKAGIDCVDCHTPHNNGLVNNDVNTTCGSCHKEALVDKVHMSKDMTCVDCHMKQPVEKAGLKVTNIGHSMEIDPAICSSCHGDIHKLGMNTGEGASATASATEQGTPVASQSGSGTAITPPITPVTEANLAMGIAAGAIGTLLVVGVIFMMLRRWRLL